MSKIMQAAKLAAERFSQGGNKFNSAGFGLEFTKVAGVVSRPVDGLIVKAILEDYPGIKQLSGGCHWAIEENEGIN